MTRVKLEDKFVYIDERIYQVYINKDSINNNSIKTKYFILYNAGKNYVFMEFKNRGKIQIKHVNVMMDKYPEEFI